VAVKNYAKDVDLRDWQVARRINFSVGTVRRWRKNLTGPPFFRFGRNIRYSESALNKWIAEQAQQTAEVDRPKIERPAKPKRDRKSDSVSSRGRSRTVVGEIRLRDLSATVGPHLAAKIRQGDPTALVMQRDIRSRKWH
jgi:predicted DNA-binding transcriptional regulator AlpA